MDQHYLSALFDPQSILLFTGPESEPAQQTPQAQALHAYLSQASFTGKITRLDNTTTGTLADLASTKADLALIALPHQEIMAALELAGRVKVKAAIVLSSGIDHAQASAMHQLAQRMGIWLLGPNSQGLQRPHLQLNASAVGQLAAPGQLALVAQSGALTASILDWAKHNGVGFSTVVSPGPLSQVKLADVLDFLATDRRTSGIVVYMEGIANARRFTSALRAAAFSKPVVVLKAGRKAAGTAAAQTHSSAIVGSDDVFDAVLRRAGAVRVRSFVELFSAAKCLASRYRPVGKKLGIITNGGGPGVLAADWANEMGLELGTLSSEVAQQLQTELPSSASLTDLIDVSEEAGPAAFRAALDAAVRDKSIHGILVIFSPKWGVDPIAVAEQLIQARPQLNKPLVACWMGDATVGDARKNLSNAKIPSFRTPEAAVGAFSNIASFYQNQQLLQQTPPPLSSNLATPDVEGARLLIEGVLAERRHILTEMESKALLSSFHIPVTQTLLARTPTEAMMIASQLGFPVALKIDSPDISHKSDVGGVALNVMSATAVRDIYNDMMDTVREKRPQARINGLTVQTMARKNRGRELYIGVVTDEPFGPVIAFGAGGTMIELIDDHAMELPPLNQFLAKRLIERSRAAETLDEWRGAKAVDRGALEQVLLRVSEMVCALPQLREMDINPIIVDENGVVAVDARIVVGTAVQTAPGRVGKYGHLSILPYPTRYDQIWPLRGGDEYRIRPIHPDDAHGLQALVKGLKPESRYFRFVSRLSELPASMLAQFTLIDYDREMALCAVIEEEFTNEQGLKLLRERIIGVSRYITNPDQTTCEFSLVVDDAFAGQGLGSRLMHSIMDVARDKGLQEIIGLVLTNNDGMLRLMRSLGFTIKAYPDDPEFRLATHAL
ncbi:bifunctional acetate--CoA ligase family protein/GNAT family N-acetyltransferase [Lampropedia puyangensis]|uniref:Bifunctional acetate--CoA ligase family protein/GNAT family N-acetyltransferase n=1 Tax=Lampropedia puyangensis TaxID=1330072 RepID=A0A4V4GSA9_9BURK|nr:bifunctional acetate--CoA ligase family protein/GNAT family N-acetyltransferase [Lampropedia puyangensis]THU05426.1 bifunctional acetate--CoA ligase family protein/GNAT family N-acetyltransferase [Lampropedia puyangensis]